jgi:hypothetical protein
MHVAEEVAELVGGCGAEGKLGAIVAADRPFPSGCVFGILECEPVLSVDEKIEGVSRSF